VLYASIQNSTFSSINLLAGGNSSNGLQLTNNIFANITNNGTAAYLTASYNGFYNTFVMGNGAVTNTSYPFQAMGGSGYYLVTNNIFHNAGTTNIDSSLLAGLRQKTTYPPVLYFIPGVYLSTSLDLYPQAQLDTNASPDLGYHYDPLDYLFGPVFLTNTTITINPGTAIGFFGTNAYTYGFALSDNSHLVCQGAPNNLNVWSHIMLCRNKHLPAGWNPHMRC
jgi:hypothetical protein